MLHIIFVTASSCSFLHGFTLQPLNEIPGMMILFSLLSSFTNTHKTHKYVLS